MSWGSLGEVTAVGPSVLQPSHLQTRERSCWRNPWPAVLLRFRDPFLGLLQREPQTLSHKTPFSASFGPELASRRFATTRLCRGSAASGEAGCVKQPLAFPTCVTRVCFLYFSSCPWVSRLGFFGLSLPARMMERSTARSGFFFTF